MQYSHKTPRLFPNYALCFCDYIRNYAGILDASLSVCMLKDCNIQLEAAPFPLPLYLNFMTKRGKGNQDGEDVGTKKGKGKGAHNLSLC